jgi:hypothetical protein
MTAKRRPVSPSMAVALLAMAVALGGSAFAAGGGFSNGDGIVQGCVATRNIVNALTDPLVNATAPITGSQAITPKGALIVVAPGETCPAGTRPQRLSSVAPPSYGSVHGAAKKVGRTKVTLTEAMLPGGAYMVNARAQIIQRHASRVAQLVKCAIAGPDGKTIAHTTSQATVPAGAGARITMPMSALLSNMPAGKISVVCKTAPVSSPPGGSGGQKARAAMPVIPEEEDPLEVDADVDLASLDMEGLSGNIKFLGQVVGSPPRR